MKLKLLGGFGPSQCADDALQVAVQLPCYKFVRERTSTGPSLAVALEERGKFEESPNIIFSPISLNLGVLLHF